MNVRELIEELSKLDPEIPVVSFDQDEGWQVVGSARGDVAEYRIGYQHEPGVIEQGDPVVFLYN